MFVVGVGVNIVSMQGIVEMVIMLKKFQFDIQDLYITKFSVLHILKCHDIIQIWREVLTFLGQFCCFI